METPLIDVFIGYDSQEVVAFHVLCQSILKHCSQPVRFTPINLANLPAWFSRPRVSAQSTEFSFSRFLTPFLSGYRGWSLFMDCDVLVRSDLAELLALRDDRYAVQVCQHDYAPRDEVKFLKNPQTTYAKKNWSSVMLLNNARCRALTPDYVNTASGLDLHQFHWLENEGLIGGLPLEWNCLVGEYPFNPKAHVAHFTRGGPYFTAYRDCDYADEWRSVRAAANWASI